jgi:alkylhydroperoxidase family enzyme
MPRIAPIAWDDLDAEARRRIEQGTASGMYRMTLPLQIVAHSPNALRGMDEGYKAVYGCSAVGSRIQELMRLRSAQLGACGPCSISRKDETLTEDDVACLVDPSAGAFTDRERLAIKMVDLMANNHHAIDDDLIREMATVFSVEEIVEVGWYAGQVVGGHRFMHMLDALSDSEPLVGAAGVRVKG